MNAPFRIPQIACKGRIFGGRAIEVDRLIELLEPYRGQNRRVLFANQAVTKVDTDRDGDIILKGQ